MREIACCVWNELVFVSRLLIPKDTPAYRKLYESDKKLAKVKWGRDEDTDLMKGLFKYGLFYSNGSFSDRDTSLKGRIFDEYPVTFKENETIGEGKGKASKQGIITVPVTRITSGKFNPDLAWIKNRAKLITQLYESVIKNGARKPAPLAVAEASTANKGAFLSKTIPCVTFPRCIHVSLLITFFVYIR